MKKLLLLTTAAALLTAFTSCKNKMDTPFSEPEMVSVTGGTFEMGATGVATPVHDVTLSNYSIGKFPVTQALWEAVMESNPSSFGGESDRPVETVSWNDIVGTTGNYMDIKGIRYYEDGFIYQLNAITGKQYRLPTEAEWEYAARGGTHNSPFAYSGSDTPGDVAWTGQNSAIDGTMQTHPVGKLAANALGIYDMSGNVWEWCADTHAAYTAEAKTDPLVTGGGSARAIRGGSCVDNTSFAHVSARSSFAPIIRLCNIGFRLAL
ncbi:MAG: formylglycine-generating enzyme family protein [Bacteroidales bacterium]|nr:formylglycine-generating enzyme family protein [Bacteroidales bacterium]